MRHEKERKFGLHNERGLGYQRTINDRHRLDYDVPWRLFVRIVIQNLRAKMRSK